MLDVDKVCAGIGITMGPCGNMCRTITINPAIKKASGIDIMNITST
jgi:hypothetical protein